MGVRVASTFPSRNRLPYPFSLVVRPLLCFVLCWNSLPFQDKYFSGDSINFCGSDTLSKCSYCHSKGNLQANPLFISPPSCYSTVSNKVIFATRVRGFITEYLSLK